jgi:hypothetical protein
LSSHEVTAPSVAQSDQTSTGSVGGAAERAVTGGAIRLQGLEKDYGEAQAVRGIDLDIRPFTDVLTLHLTVFAEGVPLS